MVKRNRDHFEYFSWEGAKGGASASAFHMDYGHGQLHHSCRVLHYTRERSYDRRRLSSTFTSTPPSSSTQRLDDDAFRGEKDFNCVGT